METQLTYYFIFSKTDLLLQRLPDGSHTVPCTADIPVKTHAWTHVMNITPMDDGTPVKTFNIEDPQHITVTDQALSEAGYDFIGLRESFYHLPLDLYLKAGKCQELLYWDHNTQFCGVCGAPMRMATDISKKCTQCGKEVWPQLATAIIVLIHKGDEVLLVHARNFKTDFYGLVAGFVETGETLEQAVRREVMEESDRIQVVRQHLLAALADNTAVVCLQPIVRTETGEPVGAEALTRLPDGQGGLLPPSAFISLAEREGKIGILGDQVLHKVCRFLRDHHAELPWLKWINVNLSPVQCLQDNLADNLHAILQQYGISPEMIHLEITEETMIDSSKFAKQLQALQEYGFQFSLDDYGSGYSNLYRLIEYPFRNIKLDLSIVRSYMEQSNQLLPEVIRAFRAQHFEITAEGVEDKETVQAIKDLGCEYMQGFYFSKPISMDQFLSKYAKRG